MCICINIYIIIYYNNIVSAKKYYVISPETSLQIYYEEKGSVGLCLSVSLSAFSLSGKSLS